VCYALKPDVLAKVMMMEEGVHSRILTQREMFARGEECKRNYVQQG
jgi:hypothetical protein